MRHLVNYKHLNTLLANNHLRQSMPSSSQQASNLLVLPALLVAALVSLPIFVTLISLAQPAGAVWEHLRITVLNEYLLNTFALMTLTGGLSLLFGISTGWLIGACHFRGRATLSWLLMLPWHRQPISSLMFTRIYSMCPAPCRPRCAHGFRWE